MNTMITYSLYRLVHVMSGTVVCTRSVQEEADIRTQPLADAPAALGASEYVEPIMTPESPGLQLQRRRPAGVDRVVFSVGTHASITGILNMLYSFAPADSLLRALERILLHAPPRISASTGFLHRAACNQFQME